MLAVNQALAAVIQQTLPQELIEKNRKLQQRVEYLEKILSDIVGPECLVCSEFCQAQDIGSCCVCQRDICNKCTTYDQCQDCGDTFCKTCSKLYFCQACDESLCHLCDL